MASSKCFVRPWILAFFICAVFTVASPAQTSNQQSANVPNPTNQQCYNKMRCMTPAQRQAAAARNAARRAGVANAPNAKTKAAGAQLQQQPGMKGPQQSVVPCAAGNMCPGGQPDFFGLPNYANTKPLQKFVNTLAGLGSENQNNLHQFIPIATPFSTPPSGVPKDGDYYEIGLQNYSQVFHSDLAATPTSLRGYYDKNTQSPDGNSPHYLGPVIIAQKDKPVRIKFYNELPTSGNPGSNLFIPVDPTYMGATMGSNGDVYTQNRAVLHLHGGVTPWISDGTPHQWITPSGETGGLVRGVSQQNVPDMPQPTPGDGTATYFYTNQQSARLMFYHDHSYGITRLNVYAGEAAGYLLWDNYEKDMIEGTNVSGINPTHKKAIPDLGGNYHYGIPLIIQDKTFVPPVDQLAVEDNTWDTSQWGGEGNLWFPHVYTPNQNPGDDSGANAFGRWDWGPWFWPAQDPSTLKIQPYACDSAANPGNVGGQWMCPGVPTPVSGTPEAFMDTPVINGTAYPTLPVNPAPYRFRILNASNDRTINLSFFVADPTIPQGQPGYLTEVKMVPSAPNTGLPPNWPMDGRDGGVPDPALSGPSFIQIGTEGGFLPVPVVIPPQPVTYTYNRRDIVVLNIDKHGLLLGPAERADVIVDFSAFAGKTLILYNDAPAPVPAFDPRIDYYTGDPDQTSTGGAATTLPGYGPNTRTMMQFVVGGGSPVSFDPTNLNALLPKAFAGSQAQPTVPEAAYNSTYSDNFPNTYSRIASTSLTFAPYAGTSCTQDSQCGTGNTCNTAVGICRETMPMGPKAIQELFTLDYGRMNATLGTELPFTNFANQTTVPLGYADPPTEYISGPNPQLWKVTHNGVDTHFIHFHLFNVQVINRVGWDGAIRPPDPNELGWKDTVRMNPLEDAIVAVNPIIPVLPFAVPDSNRLLDPTCPENGTNANGCNFTNLDPITGNPVTTVNTPYNFGWEYVWHCHILGHEENDMMRPIVVQLPPQPPTNLSATWTTNGIMTVAFRDMSLTETSFTLQRALNNTFTQSLVTTTKPMSPGWGPVTYVDNQVNGGTTYFYRIRANNGNGASQWSNIAQSQLLAQTINFTYIPPQLDGSKVTLAASSTSGLPVSFSVISGPATITGTTMTLTSTGTVVVQAAQAGNLYIAAAVPVQQTVTVNPSTATITSPTKGSTLAGNTAVFTWSKQTGASSYQIWVGTTAGAKDLGTVGTTLLTATVGNLPTNGSTFYVTLYASVNGVWSVKDTATYKAQTINKATITSPTKGATLTSASATFVWTAETGATSYQLWVGTAAGLHDIATFTTSSLTATVNGLPTNGSTIYVTLQGSVSGVWSVQDTATYTAVSTVKASITSPAKGSTLHAGNATFTWTAQPSATSYQLWVGTAPGLHDIRSVGTTTRTATLTGLPTNNSTLYVTLQGFANGVWTVQDTATYTAAP